MKVLLGTTVSAMLLSASVAMADSHEADTSLVVEAALAAGDIEAGEKVFKKCKACHQVGEGAEAKVGPPLNNMLGAQLGDVDDFRYSTTIVEMGEAGTTWTVENLDAFLLKPKDFVSRSRMSFAGLRDEQDRADVIAYLASFTESGE